MIDGETTNPTFGKEVAERLKNASIPVKSTSARIGIGYSGKEDFSVDLSKLTEDQVAIVKDVLRKDSIGEEGPVKERSESGNYVIPFSKKGMTDAQRAEVKASEGFVKEEGGKILVEHNSAAQQKIRSQRVSGETPADEMFARQTAGEVDAAPTQQQIDQLSNPSPVKPLAPETKPTPAPTPKKTKGDADVKPPQETILAAQSQIGLTTNRYRGNAVAGNQVKNLFAAALGDSGVPDTAAKIRNVQFIAGLTLKADEANILPGSLAFYAGKVIQEAGVEDPVLDIAVFMSRFVEALGIQYRKELFIFGTDAKRVAARKEVVKSAKALLDEKGKLPDPRTGDEASIDFMNANTPYYWERNPAGTPDATHVNVRTLDSKGNEEIVKETVVYHPETGERIPGQRVGPGESDKPIADDDALEAAIEERKELQPTIDAARRKVLDGLSDGEVQQTQQSRSSALLGTINKLLAMTQEEFAKAMKGSGIIHPRTNPQEFPRTLAAKVNHYYGDAVEQIGDTPVYVVRSQGYQYVVYDIGNGKVNQPIYTKVISNSTKFKQGELPDPLDPNVRMASYENAYKVALTRIKEQYPRASDEVDIVNKMRDAIKRCRNNG